MLSAPCLPVIFLVVVDDPSIRRARRRLLRSPGHGVEASAVGPA